MSKKVQKKTKYYVTNGYNRRVFATISPYQAVVAMLNYIMESKPDTTEENCEFYPFSIVSECGFLSDLIASQNFEELDKCLAYKTSDVFKTLGRQDIANGLKKFEKNLPDDMKNLLKAMTVEPQAVTKDTFINGEV